MFKSDKSKEQLTFESKQKSQNMANKSADLLDKIARKRDTDPNLKAFFKATADQIRQAAVNVGPAPGTVSTPSAVTQQ